MTCEAMIIVDGSGAKIGACTYSKVEGGWRFLPATTAHKASRKSWPTATASIPKWAFDASEEMLTAAEFASRGSKS